MARMIATMVAGLAESAGSRPVAMAPDGTVVYGEPVAMVARDCGNAKIGRDTIATSRAQASCPPTCPLMGSGCYGENVASAGGRTLFQNVGRTNGKTLRGIVARAIARAARGIAAPRAMRFNVVGDFLRPTADGRHVPDGEYIAETNDAAEAMRPLGTVAWSYTHAWKGYGLVPSMFRYVVRASVQSLGEAAEAMALGWSPAIVVEYADSPEVGQIVNGERVVVCPVVAGRVASCAECRLCGRTRSIVAFPVHGGRSRAARAAVARVAGRAQ